MVTGAQNWVTVQFSIWEEAWPGRWPHAQATVPAPPARGSPAAARTHAPEEGCGNTSVPADRRVPCPRGGGRKDLPHVQAENRYAPSHELRIRERGEEEKQEERGAEGGEEEEEGGPAHPADIRP